MCSFGLQAGKRVVRPSLVDMLPGVLNSTGNVDRLDTGDVGLEGPIAILRI